MQPIYWLPLSCAVVLTLANCANNQQAGNDPLGTGPFDAEGNYHEEWANDPSKWTRPGKRTRSTSSDDVPLIAKHEQPPPDASPLGPQSSYPTISTSSGTGKPTGSGATHKPTTSSRSTARTSSGSRTTAKTGTSRSKATASKSSKSKSTSSSSRYVVKKGDSLSAIASRMGSSVGAIQRANSISGTLIHPGQKLVVPKKR